MFIILLNCQNIRVHYYLLNILLTITLVLDVVIDLYIKIKIYLNLKLINFVLHGL